MTPISQEPDSTTDAIILVNTRATKFGWRLADRVINLNYERTPMWSVTGDDVNYSWVDISEDCWDYWVPLDISHLTDGHA